MLAHGMISKAICLWLIAEYIPDSCVRRRVGLSDGRGAEIVIGLATAFRPEHAWRAWPRTPGSGRERAVPAWDEKYGPDSRPAQAQTRTWRLEG